MILVILAAACLLTVPLTGGRLSRLAGLRLRWIWTAPLALGLQVVIVTIAPNGSPALHHAVHIGTYALLGVFLWANLRIPGAPVIAAGMILNVVAIVANAGVMPAWGTAQRIAGLTESGGFNNSAHLAHPHLLWLGDVIPIPGPLPNVLSLGDVLIFAGMLVLLHRTCRGPDPEPSARAPSAPGTPA